MNKKQILTGAAAAAFALTSTFSALGAEGVKPMYHVNVNGEYVEEAQVYVDGDNTIMLPLRAVTEEMGFTVSWNPETRLIELTRGPVYVTLTQDVDGYTFSRTAPMKLGKAPVTVNDLTYVPENFFDEILQGTIAIETNGDINITYGEENQPADEEIAASPTATITEIGEKEILVEDSQMGQVRLGITDETAITDHEGNTLTIADLEVGMLLNVEYSPVMGTSLPPYNAPVAIHVLPPLDPDMAVDPETNGKVAIEGVHSVSEVLEVGEDWLLINDGKMDIRLNISEETILAKADNKASELDNAAGETIALSDIQKGDVVDAIYSEMMTRSLPPQSAAKRILLTDLKPEDIAAPADMVALSGTVVEITENQITVLPEGAEDDAMNYMVLNVGDKTVFQNDAGEAIEKDAIQKGDKVFARHASMMTMSIPPQSPAFVVELDKDGADGIDEAAIDVEAFFAE